jgi:hypothetical protein
MKKELLRGIKRLIMQMWGNLTDDNMLPTEGQHQMIYIKLQDLSYFPEMGREP